MKKLISLLSLCSLLSVHAELTVTVTPGYQFSAGERPTVDTLNQLATPTVQVTGTLGGTNVALAAGSITGTMLSGTVVDGVTLDFNGSSPRAIEVMQQGISTNQIHAGLFRYGISGGNGTQVSVLFDNSTIKTNASNQLYVNTLPPTNITARTNALLGAGGDGVNTNLNLGGNFTIETNTLKLTTFTSTNVNLTAQNSFTVSLPHGLSNAPTVVRWVFACQTAELGYAVGDEVAAVSASDSNSNGPHFSLGANSTNVFIVARASGNIQLFNFTTGSSTTITLADWKLKCYARP